MKVQFEIEEGKEQLVLNVLERMAYIRNIKKIDGTKKEAQAWGDSGGLDTSSGASQISRYSSNNKGDARGRI